MSYEPIQRILSHLNRMRENGPEGSLTDARLLHRYLHGEDHHAFATLVRRHGAMVMGVCRSVVHQEQDAEDAFQATFALLARKARRIRWRESISGWLHSAAYQISANILRAAQRRRNYEGEAARQRGTDMQTLDPVAELQGVVSESLTRLPEKYRTPFVLCYLEGKTIQQAMQELGWKERTLYHRLATARQMLQQQLVKRGVALSTVLALAAVRQQVQAFVSPRLIEKTVTAAYTASPVGQFGFNHPLLLVIFCSMGLLGGGAWMAHRWLPSSAASTAEAESPVQAKADAVPAEQPAERKDLYGDPLPPGTLARLGTARFRHGAWVDDLVYSPDGKMMASVGNDGIICLWEAATGKVIHEFRGPAGRRIMCAGYSPDGKNLASGGSDGVVRLWEAATGKKIRAFQAPQGEIGGVAWSPDGKTLASGSKDGTLRLWEAATGMQNRVCHKDDKEGGYCLSYSPDGKTLASGGDSGTICLWEIATGKKILSFQGYKDEVRRLKYSSDGKMLASVGSDSMARNRESAKIRLWNAETGKEIPLPWQQFPEGINDVALSPDGKTLAAAGAGHPVPPISPGSISLLEMATGNEMSVCKVERGGIRCVAYAPDGKTLASAGDDTTIRLWDVATGKERPVRGNHEGGINCVAWSLDRKILGAGEDNGTVRVWDATTGKETRLLYEGHCDPPVACVCFSPDGRTLASAGRRGEACLWDTATGHKIGAVKGAGCLTFSPDGQMLASADDDGTLRLWQVSTRKELHVWQGGGRCVAFAPDGKTLASVANNAIKRGNNGTMHLWDAATGKEIRAWTCCEALPLCVAYAPDGQTLAVLDNHCTVSLWEARTGKEIRKLKGSHGWLIASSKSVAYTPDGEVLATAGFLGKIHVWEPWTGKEIQEFQGHRERVTSVAFSPDGKALASGSADTSILIWPTPPLPKRAVEPLSVEALRTAWDDLGQEDAGKGYNAIDALGSHASQALPLLKERLHAVPALDDKYRKQIGQFIADLDKDSFSERERATEQLGKQNKQALPLLRQASLGHLSPDAQARLERCIAGIEVSSGTDGESLRSLRCLQVLERIGTAEAREILDTLSQGAADAPLTCEAKEALKRLARSEGRKEPRPLGSGYDH